MDLETNSAYDAEVISLLVAHEMSKDRTVKIWSDCSSAIKCLNGGGLGSYAQVLAGWKKKPNVSFMKVRAHPERFSLPCEWTSEEKGNYMADKVAGGDVQPMVTLSAAELLRWIGTSSKINIADLEGTPYVLDPRLKKSKSDGLKYLEERDKYRIKDGKPPCWKGSNITLHHRLLGRSSKVGDRVITQRIGLIKRWQWHSARDDNICAGCLGPIAGIAHPLRTCANSEMIRAREDWWRSVDGVIMHSRRDMHELLFSITRQIRESSGGEVASCGCFREDFVSNLPGGMTNLDDSQTKVIVKVLKAVSGGARKVLRLAAEVQLGLNGINLRQTAITQFFKPAPLPRKPRAPRKIWADNPSAPSVGAKNKNKARQDRTVITQNKNLTIDNVFLSYLSKNNVVYWEFRAG
jgi:hypothetical protein